MITARVYDGKGNALPIHSSRDTDYTEKGVRYSIMQYFTWLEAHGTKEEKAVGAAAKDYCAAAMIYFGCAPEGVSVSGAVDDVTAETLDRYAAGRTGTLPAGVSINGITAMLESDNTLRLYLGFKGVDPEGLTFSIDGHEVRPKQRTDGAYFLTMDTGVWSNHLQDQSQLFRVGRHGHLHRYGVGFDLRPVLRRQRGRRRAGPRQGPVPLQPGCRRGLRPINERKKIGDNTMSNTIKVIIVLIMFLFSVFPRVYTLSRIPGRT
ncbi:MAG: hypothetical protein IKP22_14690 [Clostridia bacterium]|nr:hypothetical protein [Clostridia bacterium]